MAFVARLRAVYESRWQITYVGGRSSADKYLGGERKKDGQVDFLWQVKEVR